MLTKAAKATKWAAMAVNVNWSGDAGAGCLRGGHFWPKNKMKIYLTVVARVE
jgi:hypothetical protein